MTGSFLKKYIHRSRDIIRYEGFLFLFFHAIHKLLVSFGDFGITSLYQIDLEKPLQRISARIPLTICMADESDLKLAASIQIDQDSSDLHRQFLQDIHEGQHCFLGKVGEHIVHFSWIGYHMMESPTGVGKRIPLNEDEAYFRNSYTAETWRGNSIHGAVWYNQLDFLQKKGFRKVYTCIDTYNRSSRKVSAKMRWSYAGTIIFFTPKNSVRSRVWIVKGEYPWKKSQMQSIL